MERRKFRDAVPLGDFEDNVVRIEPLLGEQSQGLSRIEMGVRESPRVDIQKELLIGRKLPEVPKGLLPAHLFQGKEVSSPA